MIPTEQMRTRRLGKGDMPHQGEGSQHQSLELRSGLRTARPGFLSPSLNTPLPVIPQGGDLGAGSHVT